MKQHFTYMEQSTGAAVVYGKWISWWCDWTRE